MRTRTILLSAALLLALIAGSLPQRVSAATYCDWAQFVADVTVPDGSNFAPGTAFVKTWRLKNIGTCSWNTSYSLVYVSGSKLGAPSVVNLPGNVAPGATVDLSVNMTAPTQTGAYRGYWMLRNASSVLFGIGAGANRSFWVDIKVSVSYATAYDFVENAGLATWVGNGALTFPGADGDAKGFALKLTSPVLENGATSSDPGLLTVPYAVTTPPYESYISGTYPAFTVQSGDRFQSIVNCQYNNSGCDVIFRLDYKVGSEPIGTFWAFHEKYEGLYYRANFDLSSLAGKSVVFTLTVLSNGYSAKDRALWVAPRIVRPGTGPIPTPTTPTPTACDKAQFVTDVSVLDGTSFSPGASFTKTWRLKNVGTCTWSTSYSAFLSSGDAMGGTSVPMPKSVGPGETVDISVALTAPSGIGNYRGYWKLKNASGAIFGIGASGTSAFWVDIKVTGTYGAAYDFYANACSATWTSGAGVLPCPGTDGAAGGFVLKLETPKLEDGTTGQPALLAHPQKVTNGYIQGIYSAFAVQAGDRFQALVNCEYNATNCYATFRLDYQIGSGAVKTLWVFREKYEGKYYRVDLPLDSLAGQNVKFILTILGGTYTSGDRALWVAPRIVRPGAAPAASQTPTPTATTPPPTSTATPTPTSTSTPTATP